MTQTALAFGIERPTTLDEALNVIERLSGAAATIAARYHDGERRVSTPVNRRETNRTIDALIEARDAIKRGDQGEAIHLIERELSWLDNGWLCRA
mgnify:CR=1 FL=1